MYNVIKKTYVFSVFQSTLDAHTNISNHNMVRQKLKYLGYIPWDCVGAYNGKTELGFVIATECSQCMTNVYSLCKEFNQESFMLVYADAAVEFVYTESNKPNKLIGTLVETQEGELAGKDYTFVNDRYFTIKPTKGVA